MYSINRTDQVLDFKIN